MAGCATTASTDDLRDGITDRVRRTAGWLMDAFVDTFGDGYVDLASELGVPADRVDTIIDWAAAGRHGTKTDGNMAGARSEVLAELARLVDEGRLDLPIARVYLLGDVRDAFREVERRHTLGKIVLVP
jgi:NADPH:quinone reductase-like Zn-dependent oxidoreductase